MSAADVALVVFLLVAGVATVFVVACAAMGVADLWDRLHRRIDRGERDA